MVNKVCNLYNNCKNIQKHLSLILFQSYQPFLLPLLLHLCPSSLIILTSHLGFLLLPLHFSAKLLQDLGISLYTFGVSNLICLWSICFISAVLTHNFISSCLVCLVSSSAIFLVCILSLVSNLWVYSFPWLASVCSWCVSFKFLSTQGTESATDKFQGQLCHKTSCFKMISSSWGLNWERS